MDLFEAIKYAKGVRYSEAWAAVFDPASMSIAVADDAGTDRYYLETKIGIFEIVDDGIFKAIYRDTVANALLYYVRETGMTLAQYKVSVNLSLNPTFRDFVLQVNAGDYPALVLSTPSGVQFNPNTDGRGTFLVIYDDPFLNLGRTYVYQDNKQPVPPAIVRKWLSVNESVAVSTSLDSDSWNDIEFNAMKTLIESKNLQPASFAAAPWQFTGDQMYAFEQYAVENQWVESYGITFPDFWTKANMSGVPDQQKARWAAAVKRYLAKRGKKAFYEPQIKQSGNLVDDSGSPDQYNQYGVDTESSQQKWPALEWTYTSYFSNVGWLLPVGFSIDVGLTRNAWREFPESSMTYLFMEMSDSAAAIQGSASQWAAPYVNAWYNPGQILEGITGAQNSLSQKFVWPCEGNQAFGREDYQPRLLKNDELRLLMEITDYYQLMIRPGMTTGWGRNRFPKETIESVWKGFNVPAVNVSRYVDTTVYGG